jgi:MFS family permease
MSLAARVSDAVPELLRDRPFRRFWTGQSVSLFGDQISLIAIPLTAVLVLHADAAQMGWLTAAGLLPALLFSLAAGAWIDRRGRRRRIMIAADLARALLMGWLPVAYILGVLSLVQLYFIAFAVGAFSVVFDVCNATLFVSLVPSRHYVQGSSLMNGSRAMSFVAGPSTGGLLVQLLAAPFALAVDAVSYFVSAGCLARISPAEPPLAHPTKGPFTAGLRWIARNPVMRSALAAVATLNFFNFIFHALLVLYATSALGLSAGTLGVVLGAGAVGGLIGSVLTGRIVRRIGIGPAVVLGCVAFPVPLLLVPLASGPTPLVLGLLFLSEFGNGIGVVILDITIGAVHAALIPDELRSRVTGAWRTLNYGIRPIGALTGGYLGTALGLRPALWIATAGALLGVLWLIPSPVPRMRELPGRDDEAPAGEASAIVHSSPS